MRYNKTDSYAWFNDLNFILGLDSLTLIRLGFLRVVFSEGESI